MNDEITKILKKFESVDIPKVKKCAIAFSGGLDSTLAIEILRRVYKVEEIIPINVDVGQGEEEMQMAKNRAQKLGIKPIMLDAKKEFINEWLQKAIKANSDYFGYPVSTSMTRQLIAKIVALKAKELGCDSILEGSTGKGNDQYRMQNVFKLFAPDLEVLVPVRDFDLTRGDEVKICQAWGVPVDEVIVGGDDKTMWCRSIASGAISLNQVLPDDIWMWLVPPEKASNKPEFVTLTFEEGLPVELNGKKMPLEKLIPQLNIIAGRNGIGRIDIFEDGIMDLKSREIYEAPAAQLILKIKMDLEGQCLMKDERMFKKMVDSQWSYLVYGANWFHPLKADLDAFVEQTQKVVSGTTTVKLYKGNIEFAERKPSLTSLFHPEIRSITSTGFDQRWCSDAAKIKSLPYQILAMRSKAQSKKK